MMVYLESIRYSPRATLRNVVTGQQVPMELTSLGRAYLAGIPDAERKRLLKQFKWRSAAATKALLADIGTSISSVERNGYCAVSWQPASRRRDTYRAGRASSLRAQHEPARCGAIRCAGERDGLVPQRLRSQVQRGAGRPLIRIVR